MADTETPGPRVAGADPGLCRWRAKSPEALEVAVRKVASAIPTSTGKWLEAHNLGCRPGHGR